MPTEWALERRLDYIDYRLLTAGTLRRADISGIFGVSESQASADIAAYIEAYPGAIEYDRRAKHYRPARGFKSQRGLKPAVVRAVAALAETGHPMGWG